MTKVWIGVSACLCLVFALALSSAQAADVNSKVSVDFKKVSMQEVADYMSVKGGVNIVVERGVVGEVNLKLSNVDWLEALTLAAKQVGCTVDKDPTGLYHVSTPHFSFTTKAEGVSLKQVVSLLAQQSGQNVVVAPDVDAVVHFALQDVPWQTALDTIVKTAGPFSIVRDEAGVYRIVKSSALAEQKETRVFRLKYIQAPSDYKPKITSQFAEKSGGASSSTTGSRNLKEEFTLYGAIYQVVGQKGTVYYDFDSNSFVVNATSPVLDEVAGIIRMVDVQPDQVFVDVKFVTTGHTDLLNAGVKYPKGFMISGTGGSMRHRLPFELGDNSWENEISVTGEGPSPTDVDNALGGNSPYTFGVLDFSNIAPVLEFLKTDTQSEIVQAPQLTIVDNKTATIFAGEEVHFAEEFSTTNQGGQLSRGIREAQMNSPVSVGTQLLVLPHIIPDSNKVILQIIPASQQLTGTTSPTVAGFERFTVGESFIDLPRLASRTVVTTLMLQDGQTAVIGGLINQSRSNTKTKLPILGDIPILGWLFKNSESNSTINNLYVFISVRILRNDTDVKTLFAEFSVPGAEVKPFKPGMTLTPIEKEGACAAEKPAAQSTATKKTDVVGTGWEESEKGTEKFEVKK